MLASVHTDPDNDIIPRLRAGDDTALAILMDRHLATIQALAYRMVGDRHMAEDVAQSVFLKTWLIAPSWTQGQAKLRTWMCRIASNQCLDILRKKQPDFTNDVPDIAADSLPADSAIINQQRAITVERAMDMLPPQQRAALVLRYYQDISQREAADILGITEKAYESLLSRARTKLRNVLDPGLLMQSEQ